MDLQTFKEQYARNGMVELVRILLERSEAYCSQPQLVKFLHERSDRHFHADLHILF